MLEIFNDPNEGGFQNRSWAAFFELVGTAFLLLAVNWGNLSGKTAQAVGLTVFAMI